ncbi:MAG: CBS domain-containing protein [Gemmatimonadetes bacterium]|nr:CBS domain-containing protein [Gemmatimonadota bacterium]
MGTKRIVRLDEPDAIRRFTSRLLTDLQALERMLADDVFETGVHRIGAEQEVFLVDADGNPAPVGPRIMASGPDPRVTTEFGAFNLEINADPIPLDGGCLRQMEQQLFELHGSLSGLAATHDARVLLCGVLPTLRPADLSRENRTPEERYEALDDALCAHRSEDYRIYIKGVDELLVEHDSSLIEACNTSFQLHLQVEPDEFSRMYNASLMAAAPVLAVATNSPLVFGRRLWRESRIALFQQSVDTRRAGSGARDFEPRVHFGNGWVEASPVELFRDDIARFRVLIGTESDEDALRSYADGQIPSLDALQIFNSTIYRWIRPCYGVADGVPHLRIENRVLPAGPTLSDEIANAAFWYGLVRGLVGRYADVREFARFDHAKANFVAAARLGLGAPLRWLEGREVGARRLILEELLAIAGEGLDRLGIDGGDRDHYLGIIEARATSRQTGAAWTLKAFETLGGRGGGINALRELTVELLKAQADNTPVHDWPRLKPGDVASASNVPERVDEMMSTDLLTVRPADPVELAISLMQWRHVRHIPVEDEERHLVGLVTRGDVFRHLSGAAAESEARSAPVRDVMCDDLVTVPPHTPVSRALSVMHEHGLSALPVVSEQQLVGLVTERDFLGLATRMTADLLPDASPPNTPAASW